MISKTLNIAKSNNSIPTWAIPFPRLSTKMTLVATVESTVTVPSGCNVAIFGYNPASVVQVMEGPVGELLPAGAPEATNARLNPTASWVNEGTTLRFLSPQADSVYIAFYSNEESS